MHQASFILDNPIQADSISDQSDPIYSRSLSCFQKEKSQCLQWPATLPSTTMGGARKPPGSTNFSHPCGLFSDCQEREKIWGHWAFYNRKSFRASSFSMYNFIQVCLKGENDCKRHPTWKTEQYKKINYFFSLMSFVEKNTKQLNFVFCLVYFIFDWTRKRFIIKLSIPLLSSKNKI